MNNENDNNISPARLSDTERADMLRGFLRYADANPASEPVRAVRSPYLRLLHSPVSYSLVIFLMLGGTVYAAEGSLPQDFLYPLKTEVLEPIAVQLAPLAGVDRGNAHVAIVERRLGEAETLLAQGDLDAESASILAQKIGESSAEVHEYASGTAKQGRIADALDTSSHLETLLEGHEEALAATANDQDSEASSSDELIDAVSDQGDQAEDESESIELQLAEGTSTVEAQTYLLSISDSATTTTAKLQDSLEAFSSKDADTASQASEFLQMAKDFYISGTSHLTKEEDDDALSDLREAQSNAEKGLIILESFEDANGL